jgi:hypothetical protein
MFGRSPSINIYIDNLIINIPSPESPTGGGVQGEILERLETMSAELDNLTTEVTETGTVVDSAIALIAGLAQQIRDLADDPAALAALATELDAKTNALAAAVSENTPSA